MTSSDDDAVLGRRRPFLCRDWVFSKLQHCVDTRSQAKTCGVLVMGGPGCGKTTLCREVVWPGRGRSESRQGRLRGFLLAHHFCIAQNVDSLNLPRFILSIRDQIVASEAIGKAYKSAIHGDDDLVGLFSSARLCNSPDEAFKRGILLPLLSLPPPRENYFILVDSIDESCFVNVNDSQQGSKNVAEILATHHPFFPEWLTLVCTCRKQSKSVIRLFTGFRKICLDDLRKSHVIRDVQQYILARLDSESTLRQHLSQETADMLNLLHIKSNACILYLETVLDGIAEGFVRLREIVDIPGTLNGLYLWLCQRIFTREHFDQIRDILNVMLASPRPLPPEDIYSAVWMRDITLDWNTFRTRLTLLDRVVTRGSGDALVIFHHSFAEWLLDVKHCTQNFLCSAPEGHSLLSLSATRRGGDLTPEEIRQLAHHMVRTSFTTPVQPHHLVLWLMYSGAEVDTALLGDANSELEEWNFDTTAEKLLVAAGAASTNGAGGSEFDGNSLAGRCSSLRLDCLTAIGGNGNGTLPTTQPSLGANMTTTLCTAAYQGDLSSISLLLARGAEVDVRDRHGSTPLILSARQGHASTVHLLVQSGAQTCLVDGDGWSALRSAAWGGHTDVVETLLAAGADPNLTGPDQRTALRAAAWGGHETVVRRLLAAGAHVDKADAEGRTPLIAAAYMGYVEIVEMLVDAGSDLNHSDKDGRTGLAVAALCLPGSTAHSDVVNLLLERGTDVNMADKTGATPLLVAASEGRSGVCELLLEWDADVDQPDSTGRTPLLAAASNGHAEVVQLLLFWGAAVHCMDSEGRSVLSIASAQGNPAMVSELLDRGLDEGHRDNVGMTPLHLAGMEGHVEAAKLLMEAGARPSELDNESASPLLLACQEGQLATAALLLDAWTPALDLPAHDGRTPLRCAGLDNNKPLLQFLLSRGADPNKQDAYGRTALYLVCLEGLVEAAELLLTARPRSSDPRIPDEEGRCPLHVAAWQGHTGVAGLLLSTPAAVDARDREGRTPLHSSAWQGHVSLCRLLLEQGARVDASCSQGATALCIAAQEGHTEVCRELIKAGANPNHTDAYGRTPHRVALKAGHLAICRLLEENGASPGSSLTRATAHPGVTTKSPSSVGSAEVRLKTGSSNSRHSSAVATSGLLGVSNDFSPYASPPATLGSGTGSDRYRRGNRRHREKAVLQKAANLMLANSASTNHAGAAMSCPDRVANHVRGQPSAASGGATNGVSGEKRSPSSDDSDVWGSEGSANAIYHSVYAGTGMGTLAPESLTAAPPADAPAPPTANEKPGQAASGGGAKLGRPRPTIHLIVNPGEVINLSEMTDSEYEDPVWIIQKAQQKHNSRHVTRRSKLGQQAANQQPGQMPGHSSKAAGGKKSSGGRILTNRLLNGYMNLSRKLHESSISSKQKADSGSGRVKIETPL